MTSSAKGSGLDGDADKEVTSLIIRLIERTPRKETHLDFLLKLKTLWPLL